MDQRLEAVASKRATSRAIIDSSSVRITRTWTREPSAVITGSPFWLRTGSSVMPRNSSPAQMRARASHEFSPMPPEKTSMSSPPSAAAKRPDGFLRVIKEQGDGLGRPDVVSCRAQQVAKIGAGLRDAEQARFVVHKRVELFGRHTGRLREETREPRVDIAGARRHDHPRGRRQAHGGIDTFPVMDGGQARPRSQMGQYHAA